jgi:uncharacterized membrane protein
MKPETARKIEKTVGYTLLAIGLILVIIPVILALSIFLSGGQIPQFVPVPTGDEEGLVKAIAVFSNVCMVFFIFIILVWAGSIVTSRGVSIIKDTRLKIVGKGVREAARAAMNEEEA